MLLEFFITTVLISIPEASFVVAFTLIFMGKLEYMNLKKSNIIRFLIPAVLTAFTTSFLRIVLSFGMDFIPFLAILLVFLPIIFLYEVTSFKKIMQCLGCTIIATIIQGLLQVAYVPVTMSIMKLTTEDINKVNLGVLCFTLPERVFEIMIIAILFSKKKNLIRINPFKIIINNRNMAVIFFSSLALNLAFVYLFVYAIYEKGILTSLPILTQLFAVMMVIIIPIVNLSAIIGVIYILAFRERSKRMYIVEETKAVSALISVLSRSGNYRQIQEELKDFNQQIKEIDIKNR